MSINGDGAGSHWPSINVPSGTRADARKRIEERMEQEYGPYYGTGTTMKLSDLGVLIEHLRDAVADIDTDDGIEVPPISRGTVPE